MLSASVSYFLSNPFVIRSLQSHTKENSEMIHSLILVWEETETPDKFVICLFLWFFSSSSLKEYISFKKKKKNKTIIPHLKDRVQIKD